MCEGLGGTCRHKAVNELLEWFAVIIGQFPGSAKAITIKYLFLFFYSLMLLLYLPLCLSLSTPALQLVRFSFAITFRCYAKVVVEPMRVPVAKQSCHALSLSLSMCPDKPVLSSSQTDTQIPSPRLPSQRVPPTRVPLANSTARFCTVLTVSAFPFPGNREPVFDLQQQ